MSKKCFYCGADVSDSARFCLKCNKLLTDEPASASKHPLHQPSNVEKKRPSNNIIHLSTNKKVLYIGIVAIFAISFLLLIWRPWNGDVQSDGGYTDSSNVAVEEIATDDPTPTPEAEIPHISVDFNGKFNPQLLQVGGKLVIEFTVKNLSTQTINGFKITGHGPWKKFTIINVMPAATSEDGWLSHTFYSKLEINPGETRVLNIIASPNEPGNFDFNFNLYGPDGTNLTASNGEFPGIGGSIAVVK